MTIRVAIRHNTYYDFDRPVNLSPHTVRLRPAPHSRTPIHSYSLKVEPANHFINWQQDAFGNYLARLVFPEKTKRLAIEVEVLADLTVINPFDFFVEEYAETFPFDYDPQTRKELAPYLETLPTGPSFESWLAEARKDQVPTIDYLVELNQRLERDIEYTIRMEPGVQDPEKTLQRSKGSCRDTAWLFVQALRHLGLAARFASGYLVQLKSDQQALDGPSGTTRDFTDLHAWTEVFIPGAGWIGLDPTSGLFASEGHIPLACTPDPVSAAPINGLSDKAEVSFSFFNLVERVHEDPRVTRPYTDADWELVLALGDQVDRVLEQNDVRLTMGGEPTFVSVDDMESAQWNTAALGSHKLQLAKGLLLRLRDRFAPNGLLHYGLGKWYPGEEVPRWALGLFWRKDGEPLWSNKQLLARADAPGSFGLAEAEAFMQTLCTRLGLQQSFVQPAYEDGLHYLLLEQNLPENLDSEIASARDSLERRRLARVLEQGLNEPAGYILPLGWNDGRDAWQTSKWTTRRGRVALIPGDSPMGLRLPLGELPLVEEALREIEVETDPFAPRDPLPKRDQLKARFPEAKEQTPMAPHWLGQARAQKIDASQTAEQSAVDGSKQQRVREYWQVLRTCLCVEPREGRLHVFMPPLSHLEQYVQLLACVEATASDLKLPVIVEGYEPPRDPRLQKLLVTPEPAVIEVNVHPANNWRELVETTTAIYEEARLSRLGAEKFMLDGRHTGTGGGNHVTMGAASAEDSPFLRRPDVLRSLITFWQHHPSLSYLFSGTFVGPTSQAPRVDEGRDEMLYELEIAFEKMPMGLTEQPWLVDRLLRNLLVDITGNTHRAEFCIDKLYSPGTASGRQGILELRGFEMPPHPRMALVQALLLRCLLARFWQTPYHKPLVRWGTLLHDRFMLPHFVWSDMKDVVNDLNAHGFEFALNWLQPFEEFRFPHYGRVQLGNMNLELRWAIEPWRVLAEEVGSIGTARFVDSSVERIQVKLTGLTDSRYILVCNGRQVPLSATGTHGEYVAGVRYRAWQPPSALHPTIGVHAPLTFDLVDVWNGRSIGGCTYSVSHSGGRNYGAFPVNAFEAESRRVARFSEMGHSQGAYTPKPVVGEQRVFEPHLKSRPLAAPLLDISPEFPHTLDLRRDRPP